MFKKPKPSQYLRRHLEGHGFALDDLLSRHERDANFQDVIAEVNRIWLSVDETAEFKALITKLEAEGR